jgi:hypothetical protein
MVPSGHLRTDLGLAYTEKLSDAEGEQGEGRSSSRREVDAVRRDLPGANLDGASRELAEAAPLELAKRFSIRGEPRHHGDRVIGGFADAGRLRGSVFVAPPWRSASPASSYCHLDARIGPSV